MARIAARLQMHLSLLHATNAFLVIEGPQVGQAKFSRFLDEVDLVRRFDGIQGVGFALTVPTQDDAGARAILRANYGETVDIWPATEQTLRAPIVLLEPQDERNRAALGYDMFSDAVRREAMQRAARTGEASASAPVSLVQEIDENPQVGFLIYLPFFAGPSQMTGAVSETEGFVYAPFRLGDLFSAALMQSPRLPVLVEAYDGEIAPASRIFAANADAASDHTDEFVVIRTLEVAGRSWIFRVTPTAEFQRFGSVLPAVVLALAGLLLAVLLALLTSVQARRSEAVAALNVESQRNLAQKDMMLSEMNHRIKNSIARVLAIARQTARSADGMDDFLESYSARLGAMASAQEMLTRSQWKRARIGDLLAAELRQVFGDRLEACDIAGPDIEVDETKAQALGLTFHELATNALKHGGLATMNGSLSVRWALAGSEVTIDWCEFGLAESPKLAPRSGFGTRLIDINVAGELGGSITRRPGTNRISIRIAFPLSDNALRKAETTG
ncbi:MAG TPA: CHASE domain-containing protein [Aurantimonas sp.]